MTKSSKPLKSVMRRLSRMIKRPGYKYHYEKVQRHHETHGTKDRPNAWDDIIRVADLRPEDVVLDMGCAEGLISLAVAGHVKRVDGVEIVAERAAEGNRLAAERGIKNAFFAAGSVIDYPVEPMSYDVVLFLAVLDKVTGSGAPVGLRELEKLLAATRRQIIVRYNVQKPPHERSIPLATVLAKMDELGFDAICFGRHNLPNLIVGHRRGTDARCGTVPPFVLIPSESMRDHPCIGDARVGSYDDFA